MKAAYNLCIAGFTWITAGRRAAASGREGERAGGGGGCQVLLQNARRSRGGDWSHFFFLNVTQHLFHIYDGGAAFADAPFNHGGDPIAAPDYPRYPPMHNL